RVGPCSPREARKQTGAGDPTLSLNPLPNLTFILLFLLVRLAPACQPRPQGYPNRTPWPIQGRGSFSMRVAHFVQRYPPALGGSEAYFARLSRYLADQGDQVTVFTTNAIDLEGFWSRRGRCAPAGVNHVDGVELRRYPLWRWPGRRYLL